MLQVLHSTFTQLTQLWLVVPCKLTSSHLQRSHLRALLLEGLPQHGGCLFRPRGRCEHPQEQPFTKEQGRSCINTLAPPLLCRKLRGVFYNFSKGPLHDRIPLVHSE